MELFIWLWRELFPGQGYHLQNWGGWTADNAFSALLAFDFSEYRHPAGRGEIGARSATSGVPPGAVAEL